MKNLYLSKSDFKIAQECPVKLYYKKHGYPTVKDKDEYLEMLADGGYMIGLMARLLYPGGYEIKTDKGTSEAIKETEEKLKQENIILFEPAIYINNKLIRVDILVKEGKKLKIIEVKSKSFNSKEFQQAELKRKKYFEKSEWKTYIEDVAFQKMVLKEKFPYATIESYFLMPDKAKTTDVEGMIGWFEIIKPPDFENSTFKYREAQFKGDVEQIRKEHILEWVRVDEYIEPLLPEIRENSEKYIKLLTKDERAQIPVSAHCKNCEYKTDDSKKTGFKECWKELASTKPHILELSQIGNFNRKRGEPINQLIKEKKVKLTDVPVELVENKYNNRAYYQITKKEEFLRPEFYEEIANIKYPLHFIDFETSQMAVPYHAGMRPYGKVIFQWSCHTIDKPGSKPVHSEWINTRDYYPNFEFAEKLMEYIGNTGTLMSWTKYENTQLKYIYYSIKERGYTNKKLLNWLNEVAAINKGDDSRIVDMNNLALKYYFHPFMGGRTSIKVTLPAVLKATKSEKIKDYLKEEELLKIENGEIVDPYTCLAEFDIFNKAEKVKDGSGAMRAYQDMMYGVNNNNPEIKEEYKNALLKYCKLDTLAMVIIWEHWINELKWD